jgi:hypothetical protein
MSSNDEYPRPRQLRLILPPGINHAVHQLSLKEGRSFSAMAVRLIGESLDERARQSPKPNEDLKRLVQILTSAIAPSPAEQVS